MSIFLPAVAAFASVNSSLYIFPRGTQRAIARPPYATLVTMTSSSGNAFLSAGVKETSKSRFFILDWPEHRNRCVRFPDAGVVDADDIDLMLDEDAAGTDQAPFDLTGDGQVTGADCDSLICERCTCDWGSDSRH